jgi:hypothetical protein
MSMLVPAIAQPVDALRSSHQHLLEPIVVMQALIEIAAALLLAGLMFIDFEFHTATMQLAPRPSTAAHRDSFVAAR